jgi:hypothetical protein
MVIKTLDPDQILDLNRYLAKMQKHCIKEEIYCFFR